MSVVELTRAMEVEGLIHNLLDEPYGGLSDPDADAKRNCLFRALEENRDRLRDLFNAGVVTADELIVAIDEITQAVAEELWAGAKPDYCSQQVCLSFAKLVDQHAGQ